ncbi:uncharacterized protein ColSpa_08727 [Colletotrichum spaethianum]|uniref:Uncharacterized protein n=1 Tax=Colletotrichum spaethianum TaxID=700344 RepID=A0AA37PA92_9PEZI|nr:uncharacterized protein ColSpa_08727 [Colletotrichum spaethianum]GKT48546.1 hypothetical protein ColSpa_08727 [Colletotrichum spaethianum]
MSRTSPPSWRSGGEYQNEKGLSDVVIGVGMVKASRDFLLLSDKRRRVVARGGCHTSIQLDNSSALETLKSRA